MAPEVIMETFSYKCDVWSLGCCLFALMHQCPDSNCRIDPTGLHLYPFRPPSGRSPSELQTFLEVQANGPDKRSLVSADQVHKLLELMLSFSERARPSMLQVLNHEWFEVVRRRSHKPLTPAQMNVVLSFASQMQVDQDAMMALASRISMDNMQELAFVADLRLANGSSKEARLARILQLAGLPMHAAQSAISCYQQGQRNSLS